IRNLGRNEIADSAEANWVGARRVVSPDDLLAILHACAFGNDNDGEAWSAHALLDVGRDHAEIEGDFGQQNHVGSARNSCGECNPACIAAHDFAHHHAVMAVCGGMQTIERLGRSRNGGQEAEGDLGSDEVIVDRLWDADDVDARFRHRRGACHRSVTTDDDDGVESFARERGETFLGAICPNRFASLGAARAIARGIALIVRAKNRAAARQDAGDILDSKRSHAMFDEPLEAVFNADHLDAVLQDRGLCNGTDDCVEAGAVAAASENAESARGRGHVV
ncbi:MAG: hypothetical protein RIR10_2167, partial [Planctomycetota bacterium]